MPKPLERHIALPLLTSLLALFSVSCRSSSFGSFSTTEVAPSPPVSAVPVSRKVQTSAASSSAIPDPAFYQQAIDRASSAFILSQSAQSQDDWQLVARRWQQAIDLMASVPASSRRHAQAQLKVAEYRRNLTYAQQQANRPTDAPNPNGTIVIRPESRSSQALPSRPVPLSPPVATVAQQPTQPETSDVGAQGGQVFYAPIVRREGNTPVIQVTFNGNQRFEMIVDTGASGTLITQRMAQALGVVPVAAAMVDTASERGVTVPLGYVNSIEVNGAVAQDVLVAIAGPQLGIGLLGHDFFGNYDVTIRQNEVEFRERLAEEG